jgi:D-glycero-D-manno-heptose 1,7-bisphosphate phosphatase
VTRASGPNRPGAVFLDRDGTLNRALMRNDIPTSPACVEQVEILPGVPQALERLKRAGLLLVVVTNQPDVARGTLERRNVEQINAYLGRRLPLDAIFCCYHDDADDCPCRKPRPGMLIDAAERFGVLLPLSFVVGDRWRDIEAGQRAGCTTVLLRQAYSGDSVRPDFEAADLSQAAEIILRSGKEWGR